ATAAPDGFPGPLRLARPAVARPGLRHRAGPGPAVTGCETRSGRRAARARGALLRGPREVPAPVFRRPATAGGHRTGAVRRAGAGGLRRADVRPRRVGAGAGAES